MKRMIRSAVAAAILVPALTSAGHATLRASGDPTIRKDVGTATLLSSTAILRVALENEDEVAETLEKPLPDQSDSIAEDHGLALPSRLPDVVAQNTGGQDATENPAAADAPAAEATAEAPAAEVKVDPAAEAPAQAPAAEAPAAEAQVEPAAEAPAQAPDAEAPAAEAQVEPAAEAPAQAPAAEAPAAEAQVEPAAEAPAEAPAAEAPAAEVNVEPAAEAPAEVPAAEAPAAEVKNEPAAEAPAEAPAAEAPTAEVKSESAAEAPAEAPAATTQPAAEAAEPAATQQQAPASAVTTSEPRSTPSAPADDKAQGGAVQNATVPETSTQQRLERAETSPTAIVPDDVSDGERQKLQQAEQRRRKQAKKRRRELIGAAAAGAAVGALIPLLGGRIVGDEGDRFVVEQDGDIFVRKDESALLREYGTDIVVEDLAQGRTRETIIRRNGVKVVTLRSPGGYVLRREKVFPNGDEIVLFDASDDPGPRHINYDRRLPPLRYDIAEDDYVVSGGRRDRRFLRETFLAPPVEAVETGYTLREVRQSNRLRSKVRRVDLDTITFDSGSAALRRSQVDLLGNIAGSMLDVIEQNPNSVFLVEGHTDAVGPEINNLTLSDRRAETVARILVEVYGLPPENLIIEGYGEAYLKVQTQVDERRNRRVTVRNISPLLARGSQ